MLAILYGAYLGINALVGIRRSTDIEAWRPFVWELSSVVVVFALIPLIVRFEKTFRIDAKPRSRAIAMHAAAAVVFSAMHITGFWILRVAAYAVAGENYDFGSFSSNVFYELQKDLVTYLIVLGAIFANREFQIRRSSDLHAAELSAELSQARLKHLTAQIEPHFLFNSLNAISNRMHEDVEAADRMISDLGGLLRAAYDNDNHLFIPLGQELEWLRGYASMMSERFRGKLFFELSVAPGLGSLAVPRLLLQPLVENAFTHGLADGEGRVRVVVERTGSRLFYRVSDDGIGLRGAPRPGTGLSNVARRLELLFPSTHAFDLRPNQPTGTVVTLNFPVAD